MKLTGRRESSNVEDRRGMSGGAKAGIGGIGAIIVAALFAWMSGGDPVSAGLQAAQQQMSAKTESVDPESFTEEEQQLATECKQILASTEDVWGRVFQEMGRTYEPPTLVLFSNQVNSACGSASAAVGPFYCSGDQKLYIDLSFFTQMKRQLGVEGNTFAYVNNSGEAFAQKLYAEDPDNVILDGLDDCDISPIVVRVLMTKPKFLDEILSKKGRHAKERAFDNLVDSIRHADRLIKSKNAAGKQAPKQTGVEAPKKGLGNIKPTGKQAKAGSADDAPVVKDSAYWNNYLKAHGAY